MRPILVIPARLASTRFPNKPLAPILGVSMIVQVLRRAWEAELGPVLVAAAEEAIAEAVRQAGGSAVLTDPAHPSGSDRIWEAIGRHDPDGRYDVVVNVQGDLPTVAPAAVRAALDPLTDPTTGPEVAIGTIAAPITDARELGDPNVVKAAAEIAPEDLARGQGRGRALYFSRAPVPGGESGAHLHHIGLYAWRRAALGRFVGLPPSVLERRERLEQLRALAAGMRIDLALVADVPLGVDTPADAVRAEAILAGR